jgi:DNA-binding phage protein
MGYATGPDRLPALSEKGNTRLNTMAAILAAFGLLP